jgi:hypothetical protein
MWHDFVYTIIETNIVSRTTHSQHLPLLGRAYINRFVLVRPAVNLIQHLYIVPGTPNSILEIVHSAIMLPHLMIFFRLQAVVECC